MEKKRRTNETGQKSSSTVGTADGEEQSTSKRENQSQDSKEADLGV